MDPNTFPEVQGTAQCGLLPEANSSVWYIARGQRPSCSLHQGEKLGVLTVQALKTILLPNSVFIVLSLQL